MEDHGRKISCRAENPLLQNSVKTDEKILEVYCKFTIVYCTLPSNQNYVSKNCDECLMYTFSCSKTLLQVTLDMCCSSLFFSLPKYYVSWTLEFWDKNDICKLKTKLPFYLKY